MDSNALIEAVKLYPALYSKQQSSGISIEQKNLIWKEISLKINQPPEKCKAKWRNLRDSYQKSVKYRQELEAIGKLSIYHEYRHEAALSFLEVGSKRKSSDGEKRPKSAKKPREEFFETSYSETQDYSPAHAVEYLIETDHDNNESRIENDEDEEEQAETEMIFQPASGDEEQQIQEITHDQIENDISVIKSEEQVAQTVFAYETTVENEIETTPHEEITYQESFVSETKPLVPSELDSWLNSLKQTLLSFPKLTRARAKKQINDVVSELEINYLESIELERSQNI